MKILIERSKNINFEKRHNINKDILEIEGECFGVNIKIILVYFDVDKGVTGELNNKKIRGEIEKSINKHKKGGLMILGDYNGHSELLEPDRK